MHGGHPMDLGADLLPGGDRLVGRDANLRSGAPHHGLGELRLQRLAELERIGTAELTRIILHSTKPGRGFLVLNPLSFTRRVVVPLPKDVLPPAVGGVIKAVEFDSTRRERTACPSRSATPPASRCKSS